MKKILIFVIMLSMSILNANDLDSIDTIFSTNRLSSIPEIAQNLGAKGSLAHYQKDYVRAIAYYKSSLTLKEQIGLDKSSSYANLLFLLSIAEHKSGNSCNSITHIKKVIGLYSYLGMTKDVITAEEELILYNENCKKEKTLSLN